MHVIEVGGQPTNEQGWSASWLLDYEEVSPEPPTDPEVAPVEYTVTLGDDVHYEKVTITGTLNPIRPPS
jgi:hypothetical protein